MNTPDSAYSAAGEAVGKLDQLTDRPELSHIIAEAVRAAAPYIAARALRDAADSYRAEWLYSKESAAIKSVRLGFAVTLKRRADEIERGHTPTNS